jgi:predicted permease
MLSDILIRVRALFRGKAVEIELDEELRFHFEEQIAKFVESGMTPAEARRRARLAFGGSDQIKEECREARGVSLIETLLQDIRYGLRMLLKNWKVASVAAFSLGVAMTFSVAALSIFNGVLLRPPFASAPDQLVTIYTSTASHEFDAVSYPDYKYYRDNNQSFSGVAAFPSQISKLRLTHGDRDETGMMEVTSDNYFGVMGIRPALGQLFVAGDGGKNTLSAVLTYSCWKKWGADPTIIGKTVVLNRHTLTIVGVAPKNFTGVVFGFGADIIVTLGTSAQVLQSPQALTELDNPWLVLIGRLKPGIAAKSAAAELRAMSDQLASAHPQEDRGRVAVLTSATVLPPDSRSAAKLISAVLIAIVVMVLLIACANVANLLLGLATGRRQEILIRTALGATRGRLIRQLLTESAILCAAGGAAGFFIATGVLRKFSQFETSISILGSLNFATNFAADGTVVAMTLGLILLATLATGLTPALYASAPNIAGALSGEAVVGGTRKAFIRNALVAVQVAVCTLVLVGVGLCLRSLRNLQEVNVGFSARNLAGLMIDLQSNGISETQGPSMYERLRQSASELPGVESRSLAVEFPLIDDNWTSDDVRIEGRRDDSGQSVQIPTNVVDGDYFATLGIPLLAGRTFDSSDTEKSPEVAVINHIMADTYWPGGNAVGKEVHFQNGKRVVTVIGVAADGKYNTLDEPARPVMYYALSQHYQPILMLIVRTQGKPQLWLLPLSQMAGSLGMKLDMPPFTSDDVMRFALMIPLLTLGTVIGLGAVALMLAIVGLYGSVFYSVNERKREIGIRVALGAQPIDLVRMCLWQAAVISGAGVVAGLLLGVGATILFRSQFYGIGAIELQVLVPVTIAMELISMAIAYAAARPWIHLNPMDAVRHA